MFLSPSSHCLHQGPLEAVKSVVWNICTESHAVFKSWPWQPWILIRNWRLRLPLTNLAWSCQADHSGHFIRYWQWLTQICLNHWPISYRHKVRQLWSCQTSCYPAATLFFVAAFMRFGSVSVGKILHWTYRCVMLNLIMIFIRLGKVWQNYSNESTFFSSMCTVIGCSNLFEFTLFLVDQSWNILFLAAFSLTT
jgi:hypothetical protein